MTRHLPERLHIEMTSLYPRWLCYVRDERGTANGGFFRGFRAHSEMFAWLTKHGYETRVSGPIGGAVAA